MSARESQSCETPQPTNGLDKRVTATDPAGEPTMPMESTDTVAADAIEQEMIPVSALLENVEWIAWTTLVLCPVLRLINGPAVATDQAVMRGSVAVLAAIVAISTTVYRLVSTRAASSQKKCAAEE